MKENLNCVIKKCIVTGSVLEDNDFSSFQEKGGFYLFQLKFIKKGEFINRKLHFQTGRNDFSVKLRNYLQFPDLKISNTLTFL